MALSYDYALLAFNDGGNVIRLWEVGEVRELWSVNLGTDFSLSIGVLAFSPDGELLASTQADGSLTLWEARTGQESQCLTGHTGRVVSASFSPDGSLLASASRDNSVRLWEVTTAETLWALSGSLSSPYRTHQYEVIRVAFNPDGTMLAFACVDGAIKLWDVGSLLP